MADRKLPPLNPGNLTVHLPQRSSRNWKKIWTFVGVILSTLLVVSIMMGIIVSSMHTSPATTPVLQAQNPIGNICDWPQSPEYGQDTIYPPSGGKTPGQPGYSDYQAGGVFIPSDEVLITARLIQNAGRWNLDIEQVMAHGFIDLGHHDIVSYGIDYPETDDTMLQQMQWIGLHYGWPTTMNSLLQMRPADRCRTFNPYTKTILSYGYTCGIPQDPAASAQQSGAFGLSNDYGGTAFQKPPQGGVIAYVFKSDGPYIDSPLELDLERADFSDYPNESLPHGTLGYYFFTGNAEATHTLVDQAWAFFEYKAYPAVRISDQTLNNLSDIYDPSVLCNNFK